MRIFLADPTENVIDLVAAKFSREDKGYPESYLCCLKERLILLGVGYIVVFIQIVIIPRELYSGKLMIRIPPEVHAAVATAAQVHGKSINQWASETLKKAAHI